MQLYARCATLWRRNNVGQLIGLDYAGLESMMRMLGHRPKAQRKLFGKIQIIERAVMDTTREQSENGDEN